MMGIPKFTMFKAFFLVSSQLYTVAQICQIVVLVNIFRKNKMKKTPKCQKSARQC